MDQEAARMTGRSGDKADPSVKKGRPTGTLASQPSTGMSKAGGAQKEGIPVQRVKRGASQKSEYP